MRIDEVTTRESLRYFYGIEKEIYHDNAYSRATLNPILSQLVEGKSTFCNRASIAPFILSKADATVGRFVLIQDEQLQNHVQVSFFEALSGLSGVAEMICRKARSVYPDSNRIVFGLNGHLNYGGGFLVYPHDQAPMFGFPYTPQYYLEYFEHLEKRDLVSFRFYVESVTKLVQTLSRFPDLPRISVRQMDPKNIRRDVEIYTRLNNACFVEHPFWSDRRVEEDLELFLPFRVFIKPENLLFAEIDGIPIGFYLWYPDFNQLVTQGKQLGIRAAIKYRLANPINACRLTQWGILPEYRSTPTTAALTLAVIPLVLAAGYKYCEAGTIFEENFRALWVAQKMIKLLTGSKPEPYRRFTLFERDL